MTINVNGKIINVESDFDIVYKRLNQYKIDEKIVNDKLIIKNNYVLIKIDDKKIEIKERFNTTDIYPIVNNMIAYCINDENNLYIHSVLISKNGCGILILGDFQTGKTTLANEATKYGYNINSSDQTWIYKDELVLGSSLNKYQDKITYLSDYLTNQVVKINKIIILKGISTNGEVVINKLDNKNYYIKNIFKYCNWHYDMPLVTKYVKLFDTGEKIFEFLNNVEIETYLVRGDIVKIMEALDD